MKVAEIMRPATLSVTAETPVKEIARLIFTLGITGIPITKENKIIGIVTEQDLLTNMLPTQKSGKTSSSNYDFKKLERHLPTLFNTPVSKIMNRQFTSVSEDTTIMDAQNIMLSRKFSRLPIVDKGGNLVGIVTQDDIFRSLLLHEYESLEQEHYADFIANYYDKMVNWEKRFEYEFPSLQRIFENNNVNSILDIGTWTGQYTVGLAKTTGKKIVGLDHNPLMVKIAESKREKLSEKIKENLIFKLSDYNHIEKDVNEKFDAIICMGGSLPYIPNLLNQLFGGFKKVLTKEGIIVLQLLNFEKILRNRGRLLNFALEKLETADERENLFIEFFERKNSSDTLLHHTIVMEHTGKNWTYKGITTISIKYLDEEIIEQELKAQGFKTITFTGNRGEYQGEYGKLSLIKPFDPASSDWLTVIAKR